MDDFKDEFEFPDEKENKKKTAAENDKFEVEIEDDTPEEDRGRKAAPPPEDPTDDELSSYDDKVQARIKKFTRGYHDERRAKETAERERQAAEAYARQVLEDNKRLQRQLSTGSQVLIETSKSAAEAKLEGAKRAYKEAAESGDIDAQAEAQSQIAQAALQVDRALGMRPIQEQEWAPPPSETQQAQALPRRTQRWFEDNNDWWGKDEEMTMTAMGLDKKLQREYGANYVGTEEYFQTIDKTMRKRFPEHFENAQSYEDDETPSQKTSEPADEETPRRATRSATVVAPASRSTPPNRIKLKASEAAIARRLGVPIEQYAKQVALLKRG
jgi:hypothetical protein